MSVRRAINVHVGIIRSFAWLKSGWGFAAPSFSSSCSACADDGDVMHYEIFLKIGDSLLLFSSSPSPMSVCQCIGFCFVVGGLRMCLIKKRSPCWFIERRFQSRREIIILWRGRLARVFSFNYSPSSTKGSLNRRIWSGSWGREEKQYVTSVLILIKVSPVLLSLDHFVICYKKEEEIIMESFYFFFSKETAKKQLITTASPFLSPSLTDVDCGKE